MFELLTPAITTLFFASALLTSIISAITGMAGGVLLFSLMTSFMSLDMVIPIHGLVQLGSNSSRLYYLKNALKKTMCLSFLIGAIFGATGATWLKSQVSIPSEIPLAVVVLLIVYVLFRPKKMPSIKLQFKNYYLVGIAAGFLGIFIGTVGPFIAVFFVRDDLNKQEIISNKAFMQMMIHLTKIPAFLYLGFDYAAIASLSLLMVLGAFIGSKMGVAILNRIDQKVFMILFKSCLFLGACRLTYKIFME